VCDQGPACNGESYTTCNADGSGYTGAETTCSAGEVCDIAQGCTATAVDTVGSAIYSGNASAASMFGNFVDVKTPRALKKIEAYVQTSGTNQVTWVVYVQNGSSYDRVAQQATSRPPTSGFMASDEMSVTLESGKRYFIGVLISYPFSYSYQLSGFPKYVSFGDAVGGSLLWTSSPPASTSLTFSSTAYYQRLTTERVSAP
jgi:hypothetical protein